MADKGGKTMRLDRFLAEMGEGTRTQIRDMAKNGRIAVNGVIEKKADRKIDPEAVQVTVDGRPVLYAKFEYYMLNKPQGVVSATEDRLHTTVVELIAERKRGDLFPVGRLDIDTEGLLLITNDGDLAHRLLSPKKHVDKQYLAVLDGTLPADAARIFKEGIVLENGTKTLPAELVRAGGGTLSEGAKTFPGNLAGGGGEMMTEGAKTFPANLAGAGAETLPDEERTAWILTIREGKFHQVKRMFEALGCRVTYLKRLSMGNLKLDKSLKPGEYRPLTEAELRALKEG